MTMLEWVYALERTGALGLTGFSFLFVALPLFLFVFYAVPPRARPAVLLAESLLYYYLAEPRWFWLLPFSVGFDYVLLRTMERFEGRPRGRRACVAVSAVKTVAVLAGVGIGARTLGLPHVFGIQVYSLAALGCLMEAYRGEVPSGQNMVRFSLVCAFFPRLYAGPLTPYSQLDRQMSSLELKPGRLFAGMGLLAQGLLKLSVLGGGLFSLFQGARELAAVTTLSAWLQVFALAFSLYFMLSGFGDMAQGLGELYGVALPKNFYYPYQSRNMGDFFQRFNITVHSFFQENICRPIREKKPGPVGDCLALLLLGALAGLWFGFSLNTLLWGIYLALFVALERYLYPKAMNHVPTLFCRMLTLLAVLVGFPIFAGSSLGESGALLRAMFRFQTVYDAPALYLLSSNWLLILTSCFFATNIISLGMGWLRRTAPAISNLVAGVVSGGILVVFVALSL